MRQTDFLMDLLKRLVIDLGMQKEILMAIWMQMEIDLVMQMVILMGLHWLKVIGWEKHWEILMD